MGALSDYAEKKLLEHLLAVTAFTKPTTIYMALFTTDPTDANTGTEVSGGSYARQICTFGLVGTNGESDSTTKITFSSLPATTVSHWGLYDASTSGNLLVHAAFASAYSLSSGAQLVFDVGDLSVTID